MDINIFTLFSLHCFTEGFVCALYKFESTGCEQCY